jgi:hypothetical protein
MALRGIRFDRDSRGHYAVYEHGRLIGMITPEGMTSPSTDAKTLRRAAQELRSRGLLAHADRRSRSTRGYDPRFLASLDRAGLRRALWLLRRQAARPHEHNPAAAQYSHYGLATAASVRAEYRRRGWKVPRPTKAERP